MSLKIFCIFQTCLALKHTFSPGAKYEFNILGGKGLSLLWSLYTPSERPCDTKVPLGLVPGTLLWACVWAFLGHRGGTRVAPGMVPLRNPKGTSRKACLENPEISNYLQEILIRLDGSPLKTLESKLSFPATGPPDPRRVFEGFLKVSLKGSLKGFLKGSRTCHPKDPSKPLLKRLQEPSKTLQRPLQRPFWGPGACSRK